MIKVGYFDVSNGCSGDMLAGCLIDAGLDINILEKELKKLPIKNYELKIKKVKRNTDYVHKIEGTQFIVTPLKKWNNRTPYTKILEIIEKSSFPFKTKEKIIKIFDILAENESIVHREKKNKIHFHQIGQIDAIVEIVSVVIGIELLEIKKVFSSPIGIANPAPVTCEILKGLPVIFKSTDMEITTPTGAAILKGIADFSSTHFDFYIESIGYGAGIRKEPSPNMVKFLIGSIESKEKEVIVIETNIDDMNPVLFENLIDKLFEAGALDISIFQGIGKKSRPVFKIEIICYEDKFKKISQLLFQESTTIGFRYKKENRIVLERKIEKIDTEFGKIRVKTSYLNGNAINISPEYEDCKRISKKVNIPLKKVYQKIYKSIEIK